MRRIGMIILAAGGSTRLGQPKQLLEFNGNSLIRHVAEIALASEARPVVVVTGDEAEQVGIQLRDAPVILAHNEDWPAGMGTSIRTGLEALANCENLGMPKTEGVLISVCDQPFISVNILNRLFEAFERPSCDIIASFYRNILGVPALFARTLYPELIALDPSEGAKRIIDRHAERVQSVEFPDGAFDIDTEADYQRVLEQKMFPRKHYDIGSSNNQPV